MLSRKDTRETILSVEQDSLADAAQDAVDASTLEMARIVSRVGRLTDFFRDTAVAVRGSEQGEAEDDPASRFAAQLEDTVAKVGALFERQCKALQTFNIVLFGRTGVGKSTLISAMTRGNGESVSQGESDWTTKVEPLDWHSCRIYDTPGINGWGRTESCADLERRAREAVEVADFVLVCFDSQSQQADEFGKLASWVQTYRKPIIAVLNPRNPVWRLPTRVSVGSARSNLSRAVREHATNIQDELAKIGLTGVPVVAVSSKRALFARASMPFRGPDEMSLTKQREQFGVKRLEQWSGFPKLEQLLVGAISRHSVTLRLGAINDQLRGVLSELTHGLTDVQSEAKMAAETLEKDLVDALLRLLGYPPRDDTERRAPFMKEGTDLLAQLERRRGGAFQASAEGEFRQLVRQRLDVELGTLRSRSLQDAEECVVSAFERNSSLTAAKMKEACFKEAEMQKAAEGVLAEGADFLVKRASLAQRDTSLDLKILARGAAVHGDAGTGWKYSSWGIKGGGILLGAAGALGAFAVANIWNPLGWSAAVAAGVALIGSVAATVLGWLGGKARNRAEKNRLAARRQALAEVRRNVHEVYDLFRDEVLSHAHKYAVAASGDLLRSPVDHALVLRSVEHHCTSLGAEIERLTNDLSQTENPQTLLWDTATDLEALAIHDLPSQGRSYWLGEDWIKDPEGLEHTEGASMRERTSAQSSGFFERLFDGLKDVFDRVVDDLKPGSGRLWLEDALERCADDPLALEVLRELEHIAHDGRPRICLVGDYNAGKSSFIKRLLTDAGSPVPASLEIGAKPTTDRAREYDWDGVLLVDSPGFQSGQETHTEHALRTFPDASAVIYLFQPNLVLGDDGHMVTVLRGDRELGLVPKLPRTFFVVNRSDELGVDPETDPEAYWKLANRKKAELSLALGARGVVVDPCNVFCMASDPFGLVGNGRDVNAQAFDPYRDWDGVRHFMEAYRLSRGKLMRTGVDRSVLEGGVARLSRLGARKLADIDYLKQKDGALGRLQMQVNQAVAEGVRLGRKHRTDLERLVTEHAAGLRDGVLAEEDLEQLTLKAEQSKQWWNDEALQVELVQWAKRAAEEMNLWRERSFEAIERRLNSAEFGAVFGEHADSAPDSPDAMNDKNWYTEAFDKAGRAMGGATRDVVYGIGKAFGFRFKPWGAVKLARILGKAGAILAVVGVTWDIADLILAERRSAGREKARQDIAAFLRDSVPRVVESVGYGGEEEPGILRNMDSAIAILRELEGEQSRTRAELALEFQAARDLLSTYGALRGDACALLGNPWS